MLGGVLKLILSLNVLFLSITLFWQAAITDASPILTINDDNLAKSNDDDDSLYLSANNNNNHRGAVLVESLLHSTVDRPSPIDSSRSRFRSRSRHRRLRKKMHSNKLKNSPNHFHSIGTNSNKHRASKPLETVLDDRLKRFRMLDPDEFQEMLNSWSHQMPNEQMKGFNSMDTFGGMQLENYWSRK